ncbi:MAG: RidA family protein [Planctomycetes bacterium]|nr:RidA family protein [Planctomycetota bacterium]
MQKQKIACRKVFDPKGQFSKALLVEARKWLFISGECPYDADGKLVGKGDVEAQTRQVFLNLQRQLAEVGADFSHVVKMTYFLTRAEDIPAFRKVRQEFLTGDCPTASLLIVKGLADPDMLVEIEAMAAL